MTPKRMAFEQFAIVAQAMANRNRLELLEFLAQGERSVEALASLSDLKLTNASQHLQHLRRAGLVVARRSGKQVFYRLAERDVVLLLSALRRSAERGLAEIDKIARSYFQGGDAFDPISHKELARLLKSGLVTLIDVRPPEEFLAGHIPAALNIPLGDLTGRLGELPPGRAIVAYCRGPYCVFAFKAVALLRDRGFEALRLEDGYPEWWAAGRPVKTDRSVMPASNF